METIELNNSVLMPLVGFGTFMITDPEICEKSVMEAIHMGYRLIDTAQAYANENYIGKAITKSAVPRDELFITTKVWFRNYENAYSSVIQSLENLQVNYLDLVLLHWPFGNTYAAWRDLEKLYEEGKIRAIGVSNYAPSQLIDLIEFNKVTPAVNQIETNLIAQQQPLHELMQKHGVAHQGYAPFGQGKADQMFELPVVKEIAESHGKSPRQIALRYFIQKGISVIPKTIHTERMEENISVFDFELSQQEMVALQSVDTGKPLIGNPQNAELAAFAMTW